jgi:hypothetical protein
MSARGPRAIVVLVLGLCVGLLPVALSLGQQRRAAVADRPAEVLPAAPERGALRVLAEWDARRATAWASGDLRALGRLYVDGSAAGAADVALLRRYLARGLVVRGLRMQLLRARVLTSRPRLLEVEVTDRVAAAVAVRPGTRPDTRAGSRRLPSDAATTRRLVLRRVGGVWLMEQVSVVAPSAGAGHP